MPNPYEYHRISAAEERGYLALRIDRSADEPEIEIVSVTIGGDQPSDDTALLSFDYREAAVLAYMLSNRGGGMFFRHGELWSTQDADDAGNDYQIALSTPGDGPMMFRVNSRATAGAIYTILGI